MTDYNGWTNHETWTLHHTWGNVKTSSDYVHDACERAWKGAEDTGSPIPGLSVSHDARIRLMGSMRELAQDAIDDVTRVAERELVPHNVEQLSIARAFMRSGLARVNFTELANAWLRDYEGVPDYEPMEMVQA